MKTAKSCKIILTIIALLAMLAAAFMFMNVSTAKAAESVSTYVSNVNSAVEFTDEGLVTTVNKNGDNAVATMSFKQNLVIDDLAIDFGEIPDYITSVKINIKTDSYIVTGNGHKDSDGNFDRFDKTITNTLLMTHTGGSAWTFALNDHEAEVKATLGAAFKLYIRVKDNFIGYGFNGTDYTYEDVSYYKVSTIDKTVTTSGISFEIKTNGENEQKFIIKSVDQQATLDTTGTYKQVFDAAISAYARPLVRLNESFFTRKADGKYYPVVYNGKRYSLTYTIYSFFGGKVTSSETMTSGKVIFRDKDELTTWSENKKYIQLNVSQAKIEANDNKVDLTTSYLMSDGISYLDCNKYTVEVVNKIDDSTVPAYFPIAENTEAIKSFEAALKEKYQTETNGVTHSVILTTSIDLPSLKSLVYDDTSSYDEMTYTLHYFGPTSATTGTTSSLKISLNAAGTYTFYVAFKDANGNAMDTDDFIKVEGNEYIFGTYCAGGAEQPNYVFRFKIDDDAPITLTAPSADSIGKGNVGTQYTASEFTIDASGFSTAYALYYNSDKNATADSEGWVQIPNAASMTDEAYEKDGYTYSDIMAIAYDGILQFTPDKEGAYMITCKISSNVSVRAETAYQIIQVDDKKDPVVPVEPLPARSVWAIVFLSVGTLCLIGILILIFVKPKDKTVKKADESPATNDKK